MATAIKTKAVGATKRQSIDVQHQEPKRLSKYALWRRENPGGLGYIVDRRAVNR